MRLTLLSAVRVTLPSVLMEEPVLMVRGHNSHAGPRCEGIN